MNRRCKKLKSKPSVNMSFSELIQRIAQRDANAAEPKLQERKQERQNQSFPGGEGNRPIGIFPESIYGARVGAALVESSLFGRRHSCGAIRTGYHGAARLAT